MRNYQKKMAMEYIRLLEKAHNNVKKAIEYKNMAVAIDLLQQCQEAAINLGTLIEEAEGERFSTVLLLEDYCEMVYRIYVLAMQNQTLDPVKTLKNLKKILIQIENSIENDIKVYREVIFLPYKASMWDSMESIWIAAKNDTGSDVHVIPIPYYEREPDGSFGEMHYEGDKFPDDVPITDYNSYHFETNMADVIFIHNPYDDCNRVTSVAPFFFSKNLKKYTDKLVYVPYFVVPWSISENFVLTPGVIFSDLVFVQSESIRKQYIKYLEKALYHGEKAQLEKKIIALGSPKTDKILLTHENCSKIPKLWKEKIGTQKVVFFNTNVSLLLNNNEYFVENLSRIFQIFDEFKEKFLVIWREHPLTIETLHSMCPQLLSDYLRLREEFQRRKWGILDETDDPHLAMAVSDCYFGAGGSLITIYSVTGKPMMVTAYDYPAEISQEEISKEDFYNSLGARTYYKEKNINALRVFLENYEEIAALKDHRLQVISEHLNNLDGTVGTKIYEYVVNGG